MEEIQQPEIQEPVQEQNETQEQIQEAPKPEPQESPQEKNWRELRQALKELRRENQYLKQHVESSQKKQPEQDEEDDEPYVTPKKLQNKLKELESKLKAKEAETVEDRMRSRFSDFDEVVSTDNVEYLKEHEPELALSIQSLADDPYKQAVAAYKLLKRTDYYMNKESMKDKAKAQENSSKPVSVQSVRKQGALSDANKFANGLTPELKKALYQEMQQARKGA